LVAGWTLAIPVATALLLRLRPWTGPGGRDSNLWTALAAAAVIPLVAWLIQPRWWPRAALPLLGLLAVLATVDGARRVLPADLPRAVNGTEQPNLLILTLDTTRFDHLSPLPEWLPGIARLAGESQAFTAMTAPLPLTGPSHATLFTGLPPGESGALDNGIPIRTNITTLATSLREQGFATGAIVSAAVLHRRLCGLDAGFDDYDDSFRPGAPLGRLVYSQVIGRAGNWVTGGQLSRGRPAAETVALGLRFLQRNRDRPTFLWLHFYDPHALYQPRQPGPEIAQLRAVPGEPSLNANPEYWETRRSYAGEIADVDRALQHLWSQLDARGLWNNTVVLLVTDHGESFGTHGRDYRFDHGAYVYDDEIQVGALWRDPWALPNPANPTGPHTRPFDLADLHGAALGRVSGRLPQWVSDGPSFFHNSIVSDTLWVGVRDDTRKLIRGRGPDENWVYEAYDLRVDPGEQNNLFADGLPPSQSINGDPTWLRFEELLATYADRVQQSLLNAPALSPEATEALRSLGYIR